MDLYFNTFENHLIFSFRLKEIAGDASKNPVSPIGITKPKDPSDDFKCPHDGHFGDPKDCTKFYRLNTNNFLNCIT